MADEFTAAWEKKILEDFKKAAVALIEMDAIPFAEFRTDVVARGELVTIVLKKERKV